MDLQKLANAIALKWGGEPKADELSEGHWRFYGDEGMSAYQIDGPRTPSTYREDDGRPSTSKVPAGKVRVTCLTDAPDCWWYIDIAEWEATGELNPQ